MTIKNFKLFKELPSAEQISNIQLGFTLTEVLVAVAIAGIAGALLIQLLVQNNALFYSQNAQINQGVSLNDSLSEISNSIRSSESVASSYPSSSPIYVSDSNDLVLQLPSIDNAGNVIAQTYDYYVLNSDSSNPKILREQIFPDPSSSRKSLNRVLASNLSKIIFSYFDSNNNQVSPVSATKINFSIQLINQLGLNTQQSSGSATVNLRNN